MTRKEAQLIVDDEKSSRADLVRYFVGLHPYNVVEALVIWAQTPDCPTELSDKLETLRTFLQHVEEFKK